MEDKLKIQYNSYIESMNSSKEYGKYSYDFFISKDNNLCMCALTDSNTVKVFIPGSTTNNCCATGFLKFSIRKNNLYIELIYINGTRNNGYASMLLVFAKKYAQSINLNQVSLNVFKKKDKNDNSLIDFYKKNNFVVVFDNYMTCDSRQTDAIFVNNIHYSIKDKEQSINTLNDLESLETYSR